MIIFLYGPDAYRRDQKKKDIVAEYQKKHSAFTLAYFDCEDSAGVSNCKDFIKHRSLFDSMRCAVLRGVASMDAADDAAWLASLSDAPDVVVVATSETRPPKTLQFLLKKPVIVEEFPFLGGLAYKRFAEQEAARHGTALSEAQLAGLCTLYRGDTWGLVTELDKLSLLSDSRFKIQDSRFKSDFFVLVKELAYGRGARVWSALQQLLSADDPAKIFNVLSALVSGQQKIRMADYDAAIKSGVLDYEAALTDFVIR